MSINLVSHKCHYFCHETMFSFLEVAFHSRAAVVLEFWDISAWNDCTTDDKVGTAVKTIWVRFGAVF